MRAAEFFAYARERQAILNRRRAGLPRPWTDDHVLNEFRFCNIHREDDVTTIWFRDNVREPLTWKADVLLATIVFRWFNRIKTGEAIFLQGYLGSGGSAWDEFVKTGDTSVLRQAIAAYCGKGPYVTGAYIIKTPDGYDKLSGVLQCIEWLCEDAKPFCGTEMGWQAVAAAMMHQPGGVRLQDVWAWLRQYRYMGDFMAYEVVTDLSHTTLLAQAPDMMTWANPGPGARRGLNRIHGRALEQSSPKEALNAEMQQLLGMAQTSECWPQMYQGEVIFGDGYAGRWIDAGDRAVINGEWLPWDMRTVEHTLCEFDKYERARLGEGRPRGVYR